MTTESIRWLSHKWVNGNLCTSYCRGDVRYTGAVICYIDTRSSTWTYWCKHVNGEFDTGCTRSDEAQKVVEAVGRLEGWL